ncbi:hypothetical protein QJS66_09860 [Kocuria rhizophila]|nr:hypothetical protein QJS66_09860 [Kocuria rhizophila]
MITFEIPAPLNGADGRPTARCSAPSAGPAHLVVAHALLLDRGDRRRPRRDRCWALVRWDRPAATSPSARTSWNVVAPLVAAPIIAFVLAFLLVIPRSTWSRTTSRPCGLPRGVVQATGAAAIHFGHGSSTPAAPVAAGRCRRRPARAAPGRHPRVAEPAAGLRLAFRTRRAAGASPTRCLPRGLPGRCGDRRTSAAVPGALPPPPPLSSCRRARSDPGRGWPVRSRHSTWRGWHVAHRRPCAAWSAVLFLACSPIPTPAG